jgi:hypothetical protein
MLWCRQGVIGGLDITTSRNYFGRQLASFEAPLHAAALGCGSFLPPPPPPLSLFLSLSFSLSLSLLSLSLSSLSLFLSLTLAKWLPLPTLCSLRNAAKPRTLPKNTRAWLWVRPAWCRAEPYNGVFIRAPAILETVSRAFPSWNSVHID